MSTMTSNTSKDKKFFYHGWSIGLPFSHHLSPARSPLLASSRSLSETIYQLKIFEDSSTKDSSDFSSRKHFSNVSYNILKTLPIYQKIQKNRSLMKLNNYLINMINYIKFHKLHSDLSKNQALLEKLINLYKKRSDIAAKYQEEEIKLIDFIAQENIHKIHLMEDNQLLREHIAQHFKKSKDNTKMMIQQEKKLMKWIRIYLGVDCIISAISLILIPLNSKGHHILWFRCILWTFFFCKLLIMLKLLSIQFHFPVNLSAMKFLMKEHESRKVSADNYQKQSLMKLC